MKIYLLRHADAEGTRTTDAARELTELGFDQAKAAGRFCLRNGITPALILTSPYRRARQTAECVGDALGIAPQNAAFLASGMEPETGLAELRAYQQLAEVMIVGHQPDLSLLAAALLGLEDAGSLTVGKASLMCVEAGRVGKGEGTLRFFVPARLM